MDPISTPAPLSSESPPEPDAATAKAPDVLGQVRGAVDEGKAKITASFGEFVKTAHEIGDRLQASAVGPVARYAHQGAEIVAAWSTSLNSKSLDDLVGDARDFVRHNPKVAAGISLIGGFVVVRLFKAGVPAAPSH